MKVSIKKLKDFKTRLLFQLQVSSKEYLKSILYNELCFESRKFRCWFSILCTFYKIKITEVPGYLVDLIAETNHIYNTC